MKYFFSIIALILSVIMSRTHKKQIDTYEPELIEVLEEVFKDNGITGDEADPMAARIEKVKDVKELL